MSSKIPYLGALIILIVAGASCSQIIVKECPNGEVVTFTDIDHAFPVYASSFEVSLKASYNEFEKLEISGGADVKRNITRLREELGQVASMHQDRLKAALLGLQTAPCDQGNRTRFWDALDKINSDGMELRSFLEKLKSLDAKGITDLLDNTRFK